MSRTRAMAEASGRGLEGSDEAMPDERCTVDGPCAVLHRHKDSTKLIRTMRPRGASLSDHPSGTKKHIRP